MKVMIIRSTTEEYKERSKKSIIEGALQKVVSENKKSEKDSFNEKLKAIVNMPDAIWKVIQVEIDGLESKSDYDNSKKISYLNNVFWLPWDNRVDPYWDVSFSRKVLEKSHYGMHETKQRILEFIAKNKWVNS